jgi:DNA mismatch repair ATPase MutS
LSINEKPFGELRSFLGRLLGSRGNNGSEQEMSLAPLHRLPSNHQERILTPLYQDLERLITQSFQPVVRALARYVRVSSAPLAGLEPEMAFYVAAVGLQKRLEARGISICQPTIAPMTERISQIEGLINIHLALRTNRQPATSPTRNDLTFDDSGRIGILTGPNSGGKTTWLQAVGLAQVMFQAGLFIPATAARISPVDAILTHFPALETRQQGRLAEEAERLREIFLGATNQSLVLLNESLSSTTPVEGVYLAQDVLCGLRLIGVRGLFATHLIELVARVEAIEGAVPGDSKLISLVAGVRLTEDGHALPTFQITRGQPLQSGYAQEIARQHGITLAQIIAARNGRNGSGG